MSNKLQPVRGTHDILPEEFEKFHAVVTLARELATLYGFREMSTPIFEATDVFARSMGETSDVVAKEMFTFETKGGESVTLRPEFTAGLARAFISNGMQQHLPLKLFSAGPAFRYERPQKGRQRQFHQVNFEWLGEDNIGTDLEAITLAAHFLHRLSGQKGCRLLINTLGDAESREKYRQALVEYLTPYEKDLCEDSQRRLATNPLRILDSKDPRDKKILEDAPEIINYLNAESGKRFNDTYWALAEGKVPVFQQVEKTPSLVRGLDYYTGIVFEFVSDSEELGAQNTVLAGGRYDGLIGQMGGKSTPAIGFAAGIERLMLLAGDREYPTWMKKSTSIKIFILPEGMDETYVLGVLARMRVIVDGYIANQCLKCRGMVDVLWSGNLGRRMGKASQREATHVIILGEQELNKGVYAIKNMNTQQQKEVAATDPDVLREGMIAILDEYMDTASKG